LWSIAPSQPDKTVNMPSSTSDIQAAVVTEAPAEAPAQVEAPIADSEAPIADSEAPIFESAQDEPAVLIQDPSLAAAMAAVPNVPGIKQAPVTHVVKKKQPLPPFDLNQWIEEARHSAARSGRSAARRRFRYMALAGESAGAMDARRARNDAVGEATWFEFEAKKIESIAKLVRQIVGNMTPAARAASKVFLAGNLASRASLAPHVAEYETLGVVMQAFPPSNVNVTVSVTDNSQLPAICAAVDTAVIALKRHMDGGPDAKSASVNSCIIVPSAVQGRDAVLVDVPHFGIGGNLAPTAYSICRNVSSDRFIMTRLRRCVPAEGAPNGVQVPLVDVTIHSEPSPPLCRVPLGAQGTVLVQKPECLDAYFTALLNDPEVAASTAKMARCSAALHALRTVFAPKEVDGEESAVV
jgi:hypothetical protein